MKKLTEMTDIGFKRTMTKIQKTDELVRETARNLRCNPDQIVERIQTLLDDVESKKVEIQELKDKLK